MNASEILKILPQLSNSDLLTIAQEALRLRQQEKNNLTSEEIKKQWSIAASEALEDYTSDEELTAFMALDGESFYKDNLEKNE
ncbi:MAG: hypothetical protein QNJ32_18345 [Xenococcaceae cyanobacterium MO_167.B27]|nr:hypothetical protein [Xenococcaceae cyanobacterium MO_167.B27]